MADVKKKIKAREGHRTFVQSVMTKSRELIAGEITEEICLKLQVNKRILEDKIALLENVNCEIVDLSNLLIAQSLMHRSTNASFKLILY